MKTTSIEAEMMPPTAALLVLVLLVSRGGRGGRGGGMVRARAVNSLSIYQRGEQGPFGWRFHLHSSTILAHRNILLLLLLLRYNGPWCNK